MPCQPDAGYSAPSIAPVYVMAASSVACGICLGGDPWIHCKGDSLIVPHDRALFAVRTRTAIRCRASVSRGQIASWRSACGENTLARRIRGGVTGRAPFRFLHLRAHRGPGYVGNGDIDIASAQRNVIRAQGIKRVRDVRGPFPGRLRLIARCIDRAEDKLQLRFLQQPAGVLDLAID